ncbi:hypothetical protein IAT38_004107 [Cryptococcus sp. DSM 104549]
MSPLAAYHSLLLSNLTTVQTIESAISNVTWLLPGRFEDAEVASEGLYAILNLVSGYHDTILHKHLSSSLYLPSHPFATARESTQLSTSSPEGPKPSGHGLLLPPPSDHARYTRYWTESSPLYRRASRALTTISFLEMLVEMVAKRKAGDRVRWKAVLGMESIKTFLKLLLLLKTRRPVLSPTTPQREVDLASLPPEVLDTTTPAPGPSDKPRTPELPAYAPLRSYLFPMAGNLPEKYLTHPLDLLPQLKGSEYVAEVIASCVGLVHVLLLMRASRQPQLTAYRASSLPTLSRSLTPYLIPLLLSLLARRLRASSATSSSPLLLAHNAHQDRKLATRAFLTGPMWIGWTRPKVVGFAKGLERIPIVGLFGELLEGYLPLVDDYFSYTSA